MSADDESLKTKALNKLGDLEAHTKWLASAASPLTDTLKQFNSTDESWLRQKIRASRVAATDAYSSVEASASSALLLITSATEFVTGDLEGHKARALALRRQNPGALVAGITVLAVAPAYRSGFRPILRNAVVGGGAAAFFLYPEFIARVAPYVDRASRDASKQAHKTAERFGLTKSGEQ